MSRRIPRPRLNVAVALVLIGAATFASTTSAAKQPAYSPTVVVSFSSTASASTTLGSMPYATPYVVSGCGYNSSYGGVTIVVHSPEAISFAGQMPDANGCISLSNFSTQGPGHYEIDAWQHLRNKDSVVATKSFDLS